MIQEKDPTRQSGERRTRERTDEILRPGERLDDLQRNNLKIIQDPDSFCFGMDAVLLSSFVRLKKGGILMDLGTGNGILPILLSAKTSGAHFTGLEIQSYAVDLARRSVEYNGLQQRISIVEGDIKDTKAIFDAASFDCVVSNPPYMTGGHGLINPEAPKAVARHEILCTLTDIVGAASYLLKENGAFYLVHRPFRLPEIFSEMTKMRIEPKRLRFVYPTALKEPVLVLIEGRKGGKKRLKCEKPLIIYGSDWEYTGEVRELYGN